MSRLPDPARMCPVKAAPVDDLTDDWPICYQTGNSGAELWGIATDNVRGSVMASQDFPADAREDAEAIAAILNAYREGRLVPAPMPLFPERPPTIWGKSWREIPVHLIDWNACGVSRRSASDVRRESRPEYIWKADGKPGDPGNVRPGVWYGMTLGELADRGERWWRRSAKYGIGPKAKEVIRRTIDMAAERPESVLLPAVAEDAYVPASERDTP